LPPVSAAGLVLIVVVATGWGGWPGLAATLFIYIGMNGLIGANTIAGGLSSVDQGTGSASALLGFAQYGGGMVGSSLVSAFANGTPWPMAPTVCCSSALACIFAWRLNGRGTAAGRRP
jgi:MFS transporter, DHA1 family, multidrug resistance protein